MVNLIAYCLISKIVRENCQIFKPENQKFIGRQNSKGMVLHGDNYQEYIGLDDRKGNYFYIRYAKGSSDHNFNAIPRQDSGHEVYRQRTPLKMVVVFQNYNTEIFQYKLLNDLVGLDFSSFDQRTQPFIELNSSSSDFEAIFKEETNKEIKNWNGNMKLISFDFTLIYNVDSDDCPNYPDLCTDISYDNFLRLKLETDTLEEILDKVKELSE